MNKAAALAVTASLAALAAVARAAPEFDMAKDDERTKLARIEQEANAGDENVVYAVDDLFARLARPTPQRDSRNPPGDQLVDGAVPDGGGGISMRSLRSLALDLARRLPAAVRKKLSDAERDAEANERRRGADDDDEALVRRFPFAPDASEIAWRCGERAFECGDGLAALSWDRLAEELADLQPEPPQAPFAASVHHAVALVRAGDLDGAEALLRRAEKLPNASAVLLELARERIARAHLQREALEARRPRDALVPDLMASYQFNLDDGASFVPQVFAPPVAAHVGDLVFASDGSRLLAMDAVSGELRGRLPQDDAKVMAPATGIPGLVSALGDLVVMPLFLEKFLAASRDNGAEGSAGRKELDEADPSVRGGFFTLSAFDAGALRLIWCDGDAGTGSAAADENPHGRPPGADALDERSWKWLKGAHAIGRPVLDGRRIYVPMIESKVESQLRIIAYERRTGSGENGPLVLVPAWMTFLSLGSQPAPTQAQNLIVPAANPRLALDPEGRLLVQTSDGVLACLDARTGGIDWVRRPSDDDTTRAARIREHGGFRATSDPPLVFAGDGARPSVAVVTSPDDECWLGVSCEDGSILWRTDAWTGVRSGGFTGGRPEAARALALSATAFLGYGGQTFVAFDPASGASLVDPNRVRLVRLNDNERPSGAGVLAGSSLLLVPVDTGRLRRLSFHEDTTRGAHHVDISLGQELPLQGVPAQTPVHVIALEGRLAVTTPSRVLLYAWAPRD